MGKPVNILHVEDDEDEAELFRLALRRAGMNCVVQWVWNGQSAIDYLEGQSRYADRERYPLPDLILLDVVMPRLDGFEFLDWRKSSPFAKVPVVVWSGRNDLLHECLKRGADEAHSKEPTLHNLLECLRARDSVCYAGKP